MKAYERDALSTWCLLERTTHAARKQAGSKATLGTCRKTARREGEQRSDPILPYLPPGGAFTRPSAK